MRAVVHQRSRNDSQAPHLRAPRRTAHRDLRRGLGVKIFAIGSSITSSYWNGAATYYRGIYRALSQLGHQITFAEPDAYDRQQHRDDHDTSYVRSWVYQTPDDLGKVLAEAASCDLVIKHSGVGVDDDLLEREVLL